MKRKHGKSSLSDSQIRAHLGIYFYHISLYIVIIFIPCYVSSTSNFMFFLDSSEDEGEGKSLYFIPESTPKSGPSKEKTVSPNKFKKQNLGKNDILTTATSFTLGLGINKCNI